MKRIIILIFFVFIGCSFNNPFDNPEYSLDPPKNFSASTKEYVNYIHLTWDNMGDEFDYEIDYSYTIASYGTYTGTISVAGKNYYEFYTQRTNSIEFSIKSIYKTLTSEPSEKVIGTIKINTNGSDDDNSYNANIIFFNTPVLTAEKAESSYSVSLSWNYVSGYSTNSSYSYNYIYTPYYKVYRSLFSTSNFQIISSPLNNNFYNDNSAKPGTVYYYKVKAFYSQYESAFSTPAKGYLYYYIQAPYSLSASKGEFTNKIVVNWTKPYNNLSFQLYRKANDAYEYTYLTELTNTTYTDENIKSQMVYYYKVYSVSNSISGDYSTASGYVKWAPPNTNTILPDNLWHVSTLNAGATNWHRFPVQGGKYYYVKWDDLGDGVGTNTADIYVKGFTDPSASYSFSGDSGYRDLESIYANKSGYIWIMVRGYTPSEHGTYSLRIFE